MAPPEPTTNREVDSGSASVEAKTPLEASRKVLRILVVEDSPANQKIAMRMLERRGHVVYLAENGKEALNLLDRTAVDLVLMDVHMPEMDGVEATIQIRKRPDAVTSLIPIVAVSAHDSRADQERCLAAGMDGFLSKPIDMQELIALVERLGASRTSPIGSPCEADADFAGLLAQLGNDTQSFLDFTRVFWNDTASWLDRARSAVREENLEALSLAAGCLESQARAVASLQGAELAYELRARAMAQDVVGAQAELEKLERHFADLRSLLAQFCASLHIQAAQQEVG